MSPGGRRGLHAGAAAVLVSAALGGVGIASADDERASARDVRAPAAAADVVVEARDNFWATPEVTIQPGDTVTWTFAGTSQPHNVASENEVAPDPGWAPFVRPGQFQVAPVDAAYPYTFDEPGDYVFVCQFHAATMRGTVHVEGDGEPTPTPTPDPEPTAEPDPPPPTTDRSNPPAPHVMARPPGLGALADTTRPQINRVAARGMRNRGIRVRFSLTETATVALRVARQGGRSTIRSLAVQGRNGNNSVVVRSRRFVAGRLYTVELRARDAAGNRSVTARDELRLRRRR